MREFFLSFLFLLGCGMLFAQQNANVQPGVISSYQKGLQGLGPDFGNNPASENFYNQMRDKLADLGIDQKLGLEDIEGSIYIKENFELGEVRFKGKKERNMYMRYNAFNDEFEIKNSNLEGDKVLALLKSINISCVLGENEYVYQDFLYKKGSRGQGYLKLIYSSEHYQLFEQTGKRFKEGKRAKTSHVVSFPHRFVDEVGYYIQVDDGLPKYVSSKKKELIGLFRAEHQQQVKSFLKTKNIDIKTRNGLVNLLAFSGNL